MKRKALTSWILFGTAGVLAVAAVVVRGASGPAAGPLRAPAPRDARPAAAAPAPAGAARAADDPALARPLACWRVYEEERPGALAYRSFAYEAEVDRRGLHFRAGGKFLALRGARLEQGDRSIPLTGGRDAERAAYAHAKIDRGVATEEYLFENGRAEQLFRIPHPPAAQGVLRVAVAVETDLDGPVAAVPRSTEGRLRAGGLVFSDAEGKTKISYHTAVAIDARGEKVALDPRYENGEILLEVPDTFLAKAEFPLTVDPFVELDFSATGGGFSITAAFSDAPSLAIEGGGNPYVAWSENVPPQSGGTGNFEIYLRYWNGLAWVTLGTSATGGGISNNPGNSVKPQVVLEAGGLGNPIVVWQDDTSGNFEIFLRRWNGQQWAELAGSADPSGGLSHTSGESRNPTVTFTQAISPFAKPATVVSVPIVAWEDTSFGFSEILCRVYYPGDPGDGRDGTTTADDVPPVKEGWYELENSGGFNFGSVSATPAGSSERPRMVTDLSGNPVIVWQDSVDINNPNATWEIYLRRFVPDLVIDPFTGNPFLWSSGNPFYPDPFQGYVQIQGSWNEVSGSATGGGISNSQNLGGGEGRSINPSLAIKLPIGGSPERLYVAWEESVSSTNTEIRVAMSTNGGAWSAVGTGPGGNASNLGAGISNTVTPSRNPQIAVDGVDRPVVVWVDDEPGNLEVYLRQTSQAAGGVWSEVGFQSYSASPDPSLSGRGGLSKTFTASLRPVVQVGNGGLPTVAWTDFSGNPSGSSPGSFEIFLKRFYMNEPRSLRQVQNDSPFTDTDIPAGGFTTLSSIQFRCTPFSEDTTRQVYMEVEVKPTNTPFNGQETLSSGLVPINPGTHLGTAECVIVFTGLVNTSYHWRARTVDEIGRSSPWVSFGANADGQADFTITSTASVPPAAPTNLLAGLAPGGGVALTWNPPAGGGASSYNVKRGTAGGGPYTTIATGVASLSYTDLGVTAGNTYYYVVSGVNSAGEGPNSNEASITIPTGGSGGGGGGGGDSDDEEACGLLGAEAALALAAILAWRRRRK